MKGSHTMTNAPVETKVKAATGAAFLAGLAIAVLNYAVGDSQLLGSLPDLAQALVAAVVPPLVTFLSGWKASHSPRPLTTVVTPED